MPILLRTIDEIAKQEHRCVLLLSFPGFGIAFKKNTIRRDVMQWLDAVGIHYEECGDDPHSSGRSSYHGELFIDVQCEPGDVEYLKLMNFLLNPDAGPRYKRIALSFHWPETKKIWKPLAGNYRDHDTRK